MGENSFFMQAMQGPIWLKNVERFVPKTGGGSLRTPELVSSRAIRLFLFDDLKNCLQGWCFHHMENYVPQLNEY
jgi:hypothetical protein